MTKQEANQMLEDTFEKAFDKAYEENPEGAAKVINNYGIKNSIAARQGGDEFVLFLYGYDSDDELLRAIATLEYIQNNSMATLEKGLTVPMRFSMGYCLVGDRTDYQALFKEADEKMYKNKAKRKSEIK